MYRVLVAPDFVVAPSNPDFPLAILDALKTARDVTRSNYISFWVEIDGPDLPSIIVVSTYPAAWLREYTEKNYSRIDPVITRGLTSVGTVIFNHDHPGNADLAELAEGALSHDIGHYTIGIPVHIGPNIRSVATFATDMDVTGDIDESAGTLVRCREQAQILAFAVTERFLTTNPPKADLTDREIEVLYWGSLGKTDQETGDIMKLSRWTVVAHVQSAKSKLRVTNKAAAIARAIELQLLKKFDLKL